MSINNEDLMLVNQSGVDYKTTAADLKTYLTTPLPMPWEEHVANGGVVFHVKDATGTVTLKRSKKVYEIDGTYKGEFNTFSPGEEVVILSDVYLTELFMNNSDTTWNFGELTDVSKAGDFKRTFSGCNSFNGTGMSGWDVSNAGIMGAMFQDCSNFNQDLSQWCVRDAGHPNFDSGCTSWEDKNKPVWGTCPGGEDQ